MDSGRTATLYVTGRIKDLIIIDGRNHFPQDINAGGRRASRGAAEGTAAFSVDVDDQEQLVVVAEVARDSWHGAMEAAMQPQAADVVRSFKRSECRGRTA